MSDSSSRGPNFGLGFIGLLTGGLIGFLLRPSAGVVGPLPFRTVITRGTNLDGLGLLLLPTAETSFNILLAGAILGAVAGVLAGYLGGRRS